MSQNKHKTNQKSFLTPALFPLVSTGVSMRMNFGGRPGLLPVPNLFLPLPLPRPLDLRADTDQLVRL